MLIIPKPTPYPVCVLSYPLLANHKMHPSPFDLRRAIENKWDALATSDEAPESATAWNRTIAS
jgi:hypothetical protein